MKPGECDTNIRAIDVYVITIQHRPPVTNGRPLPTAETQHLVFKAVSRSARGNRVRTAADPEDGRHWKTADGARMALARLIDDGSIDPSQIANVCRFVKTIVETRTLSPV
jgi:hypothetical protein